MKASTKSATSVFTFEINNSIQFQKLNKNNNLLKKSFPEEKINGK